MWSGGLLSYENNMKIIYLDTDVNEEMKDKVLEALNEDWEIMFYLNSWGGKAQFANFIIDQINKNKDRVTLIATLQIASAAFRIFFLSKCKREILDDTEWLAHMGQQNIKMNGKEEISNVDKWRIKEMMKEEFVQEKLLKNLWVSKRNRKLFMQWYDIYFNTKQLRKMLKNQYE
jgi:ATP-dependent protease ClpP protease subunit